MHRYWSGSSLHFKQSDKLFCCKSDEYTLCNFSQPRGGRERKKTMKNGGCDLHQLVFHLSPINWAILFGCEKCGAISQEAIFHASRQANDPPVWLIEKHCARRNSVCLSHSSTGPKSAPIFFIISSRSAIAFSPAESEYINSYRRLYALAKNGDRTKSDEAHHPIWRELSLRVI